MIPKKTLRKKLDTAALGLWSKIIRQKGVCEICGATKTDTNDLILTAHHIVSRSWSAGRYEIDNGCCICWHCHSLEKAAPKKFKAMITNTIGEVRLYILQEKYKKVRKISVCELQLICENLKAKLKRLK
jgi:hypothetical protein